MQTCHPIGEFHRAPRIEPTREPTEALRNREARVQADYESSARRQVQLQSLDIGGCVHCGAYVYSSPIENAERLSVLLIMYEFGYLSIGISA